MESRKARELYAKYCNAMAYIDVLTPRGDRSIGSAFHVGDGVFVTARHVLDGNNIVEVRMTEPVGLSSSDYFKQLGIEGETASSVDAVYKDRLGFVPQWKHWMGPLVLSEGPFFAPDESVDLAVFRASNVSSSAGIVDLGYHYDDYVVDPVPWVLSDCLILGYPPIPTTSAPYLVAARAEISATIQLRHSPNMHFVLSAIPRGGFSGGLALHEDGFALGVITSALTINDRDPESGFFGVLSVEPIHELLHANALVPARQAENWERMLQRAAARRR